MVESPLHILIVGINWPPETFIARLIRGLLSRGLLITVATTEKPDKQWLQEPGLYWLHTPSWTGGILQRIITTAHLLCRSLFIDPQAIMHFTRKPYLQNWHRFLPLVGKNWDLIYFPWNTTAITYLPLWEKGQCAVISCRGSQVNIGPHDPARADLAQGLHETFAKASMIHCVSQDISMEAAKYGLRSEKTWIIRPAVDPEFFQPLDVKLQDEETLKLVTTGALIWRKGYEYLLYAARLLLDRNIPAQLEIIGDGPEQQRLLYTIADLSLQDHVLFHGKLPPHQVRSKLQTADVFVLASLSEGISNAVLEAMACGLPVVTTDCGGMREAVTDGEEGFVVPVADPSAMAKAIQNLWECPELRSQMGQLGRARTIRDFNLATQAKQFHELFQSAHKRNGVQ